MCLHTWHLTIDVVVIPVLSVRGFEKSKKICWIFLRHCHRQRDKKGKNVVRIRVAKGRREGVVSSKKLGSTTWWDGAMYQMFGVVLSAVDCGIDKHSTRENFFRLTTWSHLFLLDLQFRGAFSLMTSLG